MVTFKGKEKLHLFSKGEDRTISCSRKETDSFGNTYYYCDNNTKILEQDLQACKARGTGQEGFDCVKHHGQTIFA